MKKIKLLAIFLAFNLHQVVALNVDIDGPSGVCPGERATYCFDISDYCATVGAVGQHYINIDIDVTGGTIVSITMLDGTTTSISGGLTALVLFVNRTNVDRHCNTPDEDCDDAIAEFNENMIACIEVQWEDTYGCDKLLHVRVEDKEDTLFGSLTTKCFRDINFEVGAGVTVAEDIERALDGCLSCGSNAFTVKACGKIEYATWTVNGGPAISAWGATTSLSSDFDHNGNMTICVTPYGCDGLARGEYCETYSTLPTSISEPECLGSTALFNIEEPYFQCVSQVNWWLIPEAAGTIQYSNEVGFVMIDFDDAFDHVTVVADMTFCGEVYSIYRNVIASELCVPGDGGGIEFEAGGGERDLTTERSGNKQSVTPAALRVYPNLANVGDRIRVESPADTEKQTSFYLSNLYGQQIREIKQTGSHWFFDTGDLLPGTYFLTTSDRKSQMIVLH